MAGTTLFTNSEDGYCMLLPEGYTTDDTLTTETGGGETAVYMGSSLDTTNGRLFITVENADGQTLEALTQAKQESFADFNVMWSFGYMLDGVMANQIDQLPGYELATSGSFFNEFVIRCPKPVRGINERLLESSIIGGLDLSRFYPGMEDRMLLCATEVHSRAMLDKLVRALEEAA